MRLILLTRAMEPSAEVLPALGLLAHHVRTMPAEATALKTTPVSSRPVAPLPPRPPETQ